MELHQLQVSYLFDDDRLLFRVSFRNDDGSMQEIRAWLTRRLTRNLWPGILKAMNMQVTLAQPAAAHASEEIVSMGHQASVAGIQEAGGFDMPFETAPTSFPLGETPLLLTAAHFHVDAQKPLRINFVTKEENGFEVTFTPEMLHGFCKVLQQAGNGAEWDFEFRMPGDIDHGRPRVLN